MKIIKKIFLPLFVSLSLLVSCGFGDEMKKISKLESELFSEDGMLKQAVAVELVDAYSSYAKNNPEDVNAPAMLFKALDISLNIDGYNYQKTVDLATYIVDTYPDYEMSPMALYLKAYIYEDKIRDFEMAKFTYNQFLEKYPDNPMCEEVRTSMKNVGIPYMELIHEWENSGSELR